MDRESDRGRPPHLGRCAVRLDQQQLVDEWPPVSRLRLAELRDEGANMLWRHATAATDDLRALVAPSTRQRRVLSGPDEFVETPFAPP